jgi:uncharacterized protein YuzE
MKKRVLMFFLFVVLFSFLIGCQETGRAGRMNYVPQEYQQESYQQHPASLQEGHYYERDAVYRGYPVSQEEYYYERDAVYGDYPASLINLGYPSGVVFFISEKIKESLTKYYEDMIGDTIEYGSKREIDYDKNGRVKGWCITNTGKINDTVTKIRTVCYAANGGCIDITEFVNTKISNDTMESRIYYYEPCDKLIKISKVIISPNSRTTIVYFDINFERKFSEEVIKNEGKDDEETTSTKFRYNATTGRYEGEEFVKVDKNKNCKDRITKNVKYNETNQKIIKEIFIIEKGSGVLPNCKWDCEMINEINYKPYYRQAHGEEPVEGDSKIQILNSKPCDGKNKLTFVYKYNSISKEWEVI